MLLAIFTGKRKRLTEKQKSTFEKKKCSFRQFLFHVKKEGGKKEMIQLTPKTALEISSKEGRE